jgi:hypothetical protein
MKINNIFIFAVFFCIFNVNAETIKLTSWVGKYPSDKIGNKSANEILSKNHLVKKILPTNETKLIKSLITEDLVSQNGEYLLISKCKPHDCPNNHSLIIEKSNGDLWIGIYQNNGNSISTRWYGTTDYMDIPTPILKLFIRGHTPE